MNDGFQPAVLVSVFDGFGGPFLGTLSGGHLRIDFTSIGQTLDTF